MCKEVSVNMSLEMVLESMDCENAIDCIKILHHVFGISNKKIAEVMEVTPSNLSLALKYDSFNMLVSEKKLELGINSLRLFYLDKLFM